MMRIIKMKSLQLPIFLLLLPIISCNTNNKKLNVSEINENTKQVESSFPNEKMVLSIEDLKIDTLDVIVVQCANGCEFAIHNYDLNLVIEKKLNKLENVNVKLFSSKL